MGFTKSDPPRDPPRRRGRDDMRRNRDDAPPIENLLQRDDVHARSREAAWPDNNRGNLPSRDTNPELYDAEGRFIKPRAYDPNRPRVKFSHGRESADEFSYTEFKLIFALGNIERYQTRLHEANHELKVLLNGNRELAEIWQRFERSGGTSTEQLKQFFEGTMRPRITRRMGNLRLVSDRPETKKIVHRRLHNDGDDDGSDNAA